MDIQAKIDALTAQVNELARQQSGISRQLVQLLNELDLLKAQVGQSAQAAQSQTPKTTGEQVVQRGRAVGTRDDSLVRGVGRAPAHDLRQCGRAVLRV